MIECTCAEPHEHRRIVLTGGPGAGKTAALELIRHSLCKHLRILPEAAGILFGGGFPRGGLDGQRRAAQRAIYFVQRELEASVESGNVAILLCDRGTIDGEAYWPGPGDLWSAVQTTKQLELARYHAVIHIRTPGSPLGYNRENPLRVEDNLEALAIDERIAQAWSAHPRRFVVEPTTRFIDKAAQVIERLRSQMPECCRHHIAAGKV